MYGGAHNISTSFLRRLWCDIVILGEGSLRLRPSWRTASFEKLSWLPKLEKIEFRWWIKD